MEQNDNQDLQAETCGTCKWGKPNPQDMSSVICYGSPPVPVVTGARPAALGTQMQYHIECIRPMLKRTEQACSRYERGESAIIIGRA